MPAAQLCLLHAYCCTAAATIYLYAPTCHFVQNVCCAKYLSCQAHELLNPIIKFCAWFCAWIVHARNAALSCTLPCTATQSMSCSICAAVASVAGGILLQLAALLCPSRPCHVSHRSLKPQLTLSQRMCPHTVSIPWQGLNTSALTARIQVQCCAAHGALQATMNAESAHVSSHSRQGFCAKRPAVRLSRTTETMVLQHSIIQHRHVNTLWRYFPVLCACALPCSCHLPCFAVHLHCPPPQLACTQHLSRGQQGSVHLGDTSLSGYAALNCLTAVVRALVRAPNALAGLPAMCIGTSTC